jgi:hypothetical protein
MLLSSLKADRMKMRRRPRGLRMVKATTSIDSRASPKEETLEVEVAERCFDEDE